MNFDVFDPRRPELNTDLYELMMDASYHDHGMNQTSTFDLFVRDLPKNWGYLLAFGLEEAVDYLLNFQICDKDIDFLRSQKRFKDDFLDYFKTMRFTGDVNAVPEGTVVFPNEPIISITAPVLESQFIETYLLSKFNHPTAVGSTASRMVQSAKGIPLFEFGLRRSGHELSALLGARAAYSAGFQGTSNVKAGQVFGIPIVGTHAHSYVQKFQKEIDAFRAFVHTFPDGAYLLIDTYDYLSGAKNAITISKELEQNGHRLAGVRLDSDPLAENSARVRQMFNENGVNYLNIMASNDLNEYKIKKLLESKASLNGFGVGTDVIISRGAPALHVVYKLVEDTDKSGHSRPCIKLSPGKHTLPGRKQVYRTMDPDGIYNHFDTIALHGESVNEIPNGIPLLKPIISKGKLVYSMPSLSSIRERVRQQMNALPAYLNETEVTVPYPVKVSQGILHHIEALSQEYQSRGG